MNVTSVLSDPEYQTLKHLVLEHTGLHYYETRDEDLAARLVRRMRARNIGDCHAYNRVLRTDHARGGEWDALSGELTIGETYFFRQSEHFDLLRGTIFPDLMQRKQHTRRLRIWSAGCATGAEAYSIALMLHLEFPELVRDWDVSILATDINPEFLVQARSGRFGEWALRETPESLRRCCFHREGRFWVLAPEYRERVRFEYHNLASTAPYPGSGAEPMDLILCRNVLIYFSAARMRIVAQRLYESLDAGGWLLVGHAEPNSEIFGTFEVLVSATVTAYRRPLQEKPGTPTLAMPAPAEPPSWPPPPIVVEPPPPPRSELRRDRPPVRPHAEIPAKAVRSTPTSNIEEARALADAGDWQGAERLARQLIEEDPLQSAAHFTLGLILVHTGPNEEAVASLRRAIYLDRDFALAHFHLGVLLQKLGDETTPRRAFQNVIDLLRDAPDDDVLPHGDGIRARELSELAAMHLHIGRRQ